MTFPIDLRSDTVTKPTPAMRRAMAAAEVGDDWYGEDPTVNRLQDRCAEVTGKEAAVFVATGTMANQIALNVFARHGHVVACSAGAHIGTTELTSSATLSGVSFSVIETPDARLTAEAAGAALRPDPYGVEIVDVLAIENTHGQAGGLVMPVDEARAIRKVATEAGVPVYLDGARLFNASAASGTPVGEYAGEVDALMFSLSKGLGAPIGSVLCGSVSFGEEARRIRILFGGAWRQAGIIAAAGLVALEEGPERLHEDHANARALAEGVYEAAPGCLNLEDVETNMVFVDPSWLGLDAWDLVGRLRGGGVLTNVIGARVRMVTHRDVSRAEIEQAVQVWQRLVREVRSSGK